MIHTARFTMDFESHSEWQKRVRQGKVLSQFLATKRGRMRIAHALTAPLRARINYSEIGRNLIQVQPLPDGAIPDYKKPKSRKKPVRRKKWKLKKGQWIARGGPNDGHLHEKTPYGVLIYGGRRRKPHCG